jgi:hypothetical protein
MNSNINPLAIPPSHAPLLQDVVPVEDGLKLVALPKDTARLASSSANYPQGLISYYGSGSTSAEFWAVTDDTIYRITENISSAGNNFASVETTNTGGCDWIEFNKTIIMVNGGSTPLKWNRASAWESWSASFSGGANMWGINKFKQRLFTWEENNSKFWYSSVDQFLGTFQPFDLGGIISGKLQIVASLTKDGGAGPDDYIAFISDQGDVAVYAGADPGDANDWFLVGVYKIGRPLSKDSFVQYGSQTVVLCEDDFYFLPEDLNGKRNATLASDRRAQDINNSETNGVFLPKDGLIIFSEGSVLSTKNNFAYSTITLSSAPPHRLRQNAIQYFDIGGTITGRRPVVGEFQGKAFAFPDLGSDNTSTLLTVKELFPRVGAVDYKSKIRTAPIQTSGRTNISLVNPKFGMRPDWSASTSSEMHLVYKTAVVYDQYRRPYYSADPSLFVTATASLDTEGMWTPGFGTGDNAQIFIEIATASCKSGEIILYGIDLVAEDTGGL